MADAIVIGAGPNGLVAADIVADAGWQVEVFEAQDEPGGAVRSDRGVDPEFVNDLFSSFHPLAVASPAIRALELKRFGCVGAMRPRSWRIRHWTGVALYCIAGSRRRPRV
jgi:phytoene dehydrogenase-like protein